mmetsp:Transcript_11730/g.24001  ORF Transcript_11730/g.24001 Transcript_11730/m.24001 type:complete len:416 (+) Transcript_11730:55-1302(+)
MTELKNAIEILPDRLYYVALRSIPKDTNTAHFFNIDNELVYWNFFLDFGPLNLGQMYRFCTMLNQKLQSERLKRKVIYYYSATHSHRRANAAFLISAWSMIYLNKTADEAYRPFSNVYPPFPPFHDASPCVCTYNLTVLDCLRGIDKARAHKFFDFSKFDCDEYEYFEQVENGDLNWHIQDKILCFAGPHNTREVSREGYRTLTPEDYIPYFKKKNVKLVVRLNKKYYDERKFINAGINHVEHYYLDGSVPPMRILKKVIAAIESAGDAAIAVHCKAGLGRAGTCTASWIMKHYRMTAAETIGWMRICRPGTVIGPQQHFLEDIQDQMWHEGDVMRSAPQRSLPEKGAIRRKQSHSNGNSSREGGILGGLNKMSIKQGRGRHEELDDAVVGRPGQSEELRGRRAQAAGYNVKSRK